MIKKIITMFTIFLMLIALPISAVFAEEDNSTEDMSIDATQVVSIEDQTILSNPYGAQVRLIQLQRSIDAQIQGAEFIITKIEAKENVTVDVDRLNDIVSEFEQLKVEIENLDMNQSSDILAAEFVEIKSQAVSLSHEFKEITKDAFSEEEKSMFRAQAKEKIKVKLETKDNKLEKLKLEYNAKVAEKQFNRFGINNSELLEKIRTGDLLITQIREELRLKYQNMSSSEKRELNLELREDSNRIKIKQEENKIKIEERLKDFEEKKLEIRSRFEERKEMKFESKIERIDENGMKIKEKIKIKSDKDGKIETEIETEIESEDDDDSDEDKS